MFLIIIFLMCLLDVPEYYYL